MLLTRVRQSYPDEARDINDREQEIMKMWNTLTVRIEEICLVIGQCKEIPLLEGLLIYLAINCSVRRSVVAGNRTHDLPIASPAP